MSEHQNPRPLNRRSVMRLGAGAVAAGAFVQARPGHAAEDVDVVVIGAGVAGLAAAKTLRDLGYQTIVIEAASTLGGRVKTDWTLGAPFEVGAGWIHGPRGNPISRLASVIGAPTFVTDDESFQVFGSDGAAVSRATIEQSYGRLQGLYREIDDTFDDDQALSQAMQRVSPGLASDPVIQWMSSAYTEFSTGASIDKVSAYQFDEDSAYDGADVILPKGYDQIPKFLAQGLDIRLNTRATAVLYEEGDGATVETNNGTFEASFVVCTVPLGILKRGGIRFDPPLPGSYTQRINRIGMGSVTKLALKFSNAFWPTDVQYFGLMTQPRGRWNYFLNYRTFGAENILLGLSVGDYAFTADAMGDAAMVDDCMQAMRTMFPGASNPVGHLATRWSRDPNTLGAYSYSSVGVQPADFDGLAEPIAKTVLLAGEHTTFEYHATVHGAYDSGLRAARIIEDRLAD